MHATRVRQLKQGGGKQGYGSWGPFGNGLLQLGNALGFSVSAVWGSLGQF
jgi:hypothetical protein